MTDQDNQKPETSAPKSVEDAVRELIEMMNEGGIGSLDLKTDDFKIKLRTEAVAIASATPVMSMPPAYSMYPEPGMAAQAGNPGLAFADEPEIEGHVVTSPMIGTYYSASAPGEPEYVQIGDEVESGQVVGIIEAMKIMNEITADQSGVIVEILVDNAQAVEYGSPLVRISASALLD